MAVLFVRRYGKQKGLLKNSTTPFLIMQKYNIFLNLHYFYFCVGGLIFGFVVL